MSTLEPEWREGFCGLDQVSCLDEFGVAFVGRLPRTDGTSTSVRAEYIRMYVCTVRTYEYAPCAGRAQTLDPLLSLTRHRGSHRLENPPAPVRGPRRTGLDTTPVKRLSSNDQLCVVAFWF